MPDKDAPPNQNRFCLYGNDNDLRLMFYCPGCKEPHGGVRVKGQQPWSWDGDLVKATINPSILVTMELSDRSRVCHSFIRDGQIVYLDDCWHDLKGQTVDVPVWDSKWE